MKISNLLIITGCVLVCFLATISLFAPAIAPHDPLEVDSYRILEEPSKEYPLGTDQSGRCVMSRLIYGSRASLGVTMLVMAVTVTIGTVIGIICGIFAGGTIDRILTVLCEVVLAFPGIILALVISGMLGPGLMNIMLAIALVSWAKYARVVRSLVIETYHLDYIKAARVAGTSSFNIVIRHIIPNISSVIGTVLVTNISSTILMVAGLSFIGLGVQPPSPEWGMMINEAKLYMYSRPMLIIYPILLVSVSVLAFNLISDGLREKSDIRGES